MHPRRLARLSSEQAPGTDGPVIIFLALIVILMVRRIYRSYFGIRFSAGRTIGYALFYVAFGSVFSILSFFEGVSLIYAVPYALILGIAAIWSYRFTDKRISFWKGPDGSPYFRGGVILYVIYVVGFVARLSIEVVEFGPNLFAPPSSILTSSALYSTIAADLLMMFGLGLLVGRNARVIARYRRIEKGKESLPDVPPEYSPVFGSRKRD